MTRHRPFWMQLTHALGALLASTGMACGAVLYLEDFDPNANGWGDRDAGDMTVSHDPANDWMVGSFGLSFLSQNDAFRIASGTDFLGDYTTPGLTQLSLQFYSDNVLPSDLFLRIIDGSEIFSFQLTPLGLDSWDTYTVDLAWSAGWIGSSEAAFSSALGSVDAIELQVTRNGSSAQSFFLDNVQTLDTDLGNPGDPGSAVPEPGTLSLVLAVGVLLLAYSRRIRRSRVS